MIQSEALRRRARTDLTLKLENGGEDVFLLEHGERVALLAPKLADLVGRIGAAVDRDALWAAALYHAAGWAVQYEQGQIERSEVLTRPLSELQRELSATRAEESLRPYISHKRVQLVCGMIRDAGRYKTSNVAAEILADACNLDQIGPLGLWQIIRKVTAEGKGVQAALSTWSRQCEYNYWQARIQESLRFEASRQLAEQRLLAMQHLMSAVSRHAEAEDISECIPTADESSVDPEAEPAPQSIEPPANQEGTYDL